MANDAAGARPLQEQLDELLREVNDYKASTTGRLNDLHTKHTDLHGYVAQAVQFQTKLDKGLYRNTRAVESLIGSVGKLGERVDDLAGEHDSVKRVIMKMAKKLGVG
jgi:hypothetical protein